MLIHQQHLNADRILYNHAIDVVRNTSFIYKCILIYFRLFPKRITNLFVFIILKNNSASQLHWTSCSGIRPNAPNGTKQRKFCCTVCINRLIRTTRNNYCWNVSVYFLNFIIKVKANIVLLILAIFTHFRQRCCGETSICTPAARLRHCFFRWKLHGKHPIINYIYLLLNHYSYYFLLFN